MAGREFPNRNLSGLPTPEASSRSSYDAMDRGDDDDHFDPCHLSGETYNYQAPKQYQRLRRDSRNASPTRSPPQIHFQPQRPQLPPLRTLLGNNNMSSPPQTPILRDIPLQPSPCEPSLAADVYKPAALYPYKKLRTDVVLEPVAPITNGHSFDAHRASPAVLEQRGRRHSIAPVGPHRHREFAPSSANSAYRRESASRGRSHRTSDDYRTMNLRDSRHGSLQMTDGAYRQQPDPYTTAYDYDTDPAWRKFRHFTPSQNESDPEHRPPFSRHYREDAGDYASMRGYDQQVRWNHCGPVSPTTYQEYMEIPFQPYHAQQSSYFVPNHYDYQAKNRKRSNLPKQSTEIMKNWFDQNISNPYPSEEQKAVFSNATGISMTQVSNWFINHRRRCPELRERREKSRGIECDA